jgi:hypothetical protein
MKQIVEMLCSKPKSSMTRCTKVRAMVDMYHLFSNSGFDPAIITDLVIYRYPVPDKAVYDLKALFPSHDVCIMAMTTPDNKQDHRPSQFEAILTNALTTVKASIYY